MHITSNFTNPYFINLGQHFQSIDNFCKAELNKKLITSERDYLSVFSFLIRNPYGLNLSNSPYSCISYTLPQNMEKKFGADVIILLRMSTTEVKVIFIEGKLIRPKFEWDKYQNQTLKNKSHFFSQLERQSTFQNSGAVFLEMFMHTFLSQTINGGISYPTHLNCSDFIDLNRALGLTAGFNRTKPWKKTEYVTLIQNSNNIGHYISLIASCELGNRLLVNNNFVRITDTYEQQHEIPVISGEIGEREEYGYADTILTFMQNNGLGHYLYIDISQQTIVRLTR